MNKGPRNAPNKQTRDDDPVNGIAGTADTLTGAAERPVAETMDAFLAQIERRAWRMAQMALGDREEALDAVQDAMLRLVRSYGHKSADQWTPLFWSILRRRITDLQRRRKVRSIMVGWMSGTRRDHHGDELPAWEPADHGPGPRKSLEDAQSYNAMTAAVRTLPPRQREAFMLRTLEALPVADTARIMGCSEGSVKTHLSRALNTLREQLEDWR